MYEEEEYYQEPNQQQNKMSNEPMIDPQELEQIRQEVELAHEEFMRLMNGRPRLYTNFPR